MSVNEPTGLHIIRCEYSLIYKQEHTLNQSGLFDVSLTFGFDARWFLFSMMARLLFLL